MAPNDFFGKQIIIIYQIIYPTLFRLENKKQIEFLELNKFELNDIDKIYINRGPGSFAGIRNSISVVKALKLAKNIDYYCYSLQDFKGEKDVKYENVPYLCDKFKVKKNLINPIYIS